MPFPNDDTKFKPGQSGNPAGKPKGAKHLSTRIQEMLNKGDFEATINNDKFKGMPIEVIIKVAIHKSVTDKDGYKWADWLAKHGYGQRTILANDDDSPVSFGVPPEMIAAFTKLLTDQDNTA